MIKFVKEEKMEQKMQKFVRQVFKSDPDYTTLTKSDLRSRYIEEEGLTELSKSDKRLFSAVLNQMLIEFAEMIKSKNKENIQIQAQKKVTELPEPLNTLKMNKILTEATEASKINGHENLNDHSESSNDGLYDIPKASEVPESKLSYNENINLHKRNNCLLDTDEKIVAAFDDLDSSSNDSGALVIMEGSDNDENVDSDQEENLQSSDKEANKRNTFENQKDSGLVDDASSGEEFEPFSSTAKIASRSDDENDEDDDDFLPSTNSSKKTKKTDGMAKKRKRTGRDVSKVTKKVKSVDHDESLNITSDDEPITSVKRKMSTSNRQIISDDEDDMPVSNISPEKSKKTNVSNDILNESKQFGKSKSKTVNQIKNNSRISSGDESSDDEPLMSLKEVQKQSKFNRKILSDDEDNTLHSSISSKKIKKANASIKNERKTSKNQLRVSKKKKTQKKFSDASDLSEEEPLASLKKQKEFTAAKKNVKAEKSPGKSELKDKDLSKDDEGEKSSSAESDSEPMKVEKVNKKQSSKEKGAASEKIEKHEEMKGSSSRISDTGSSSEEETLAAFKLRQQKESFVDTEKEKEALKSSAKSKAKKMVTSDDEDKGSSSSESDIDESKSGKAKGKQSSKKKEAAPAKSKGSKSSPSDAKIERLKRYLRAAGIHVQSYSKLWGSCKSAKAKADKLLELLEQQGLKGRPTLEKCKKIKRKIEKKKEIEELDISNIISVSEGRPKRNTRSLYLSVENSKGVESRLTESVKPFQRLKDLVDSDSSDDGSGDPVHQEQDDSDDEVIKNGNRKHLLDSDDDNDSSSNQPRKLARIKSVIESDDSE